MKTNLNSVYSSTCTGLGRFARRITLLLALSALLLTANTANAALRYVDGSNASPAPPYTSWATAAATIQQAVDAAQADDEVVVTNGTYATGGRAVGTNSLANRVVVDKPLTLRSANGPQFTIIQGYQVPGTTNGDGAIRCVYLADGSSLSGFTLTNGATRWDGDAEGEQSGGGVWCAATSAVVSNCVLAGNSAAYEGGGAFGGLLADCTLTGNWADLRGGGASLSTLSNCSLLGNSAATGGGSANSTLDNCTLARNSAGSGGGASGGVLNHCKLIGNSSKGGGGAAWSTLIHCTLTGNSSRSGSWKIDGGGAFGSTLNNCLLTGNSAGSGGGAFRSTLNNCTITGNSAGTGGGAADSTLNNCIVYFNTAPSGANWVNRGNSETTRASVLNYCCTTPMPVPWPEQEPFVGNITLDPQLASASHLSAGSPCRGAGNAQYATGTDIDGEAWASPPSIGCDEYHAGAVTGPLSAAVTANYTNAAAGYPIQLTAWTEGRTAASTWDFGDGASATNQPIGVHAWRFAGDCSVVLRAYNESHPEGVSATLMVRVVDEVHYVAAGSFNPLAPYNSWATAARSIQEAVDTAVVGGTVVVTNGTYATGGRAVAGTMTNRVAVYKPLTLRSVNGPQFTIIRGAQAPDGGNGDGAIRCVYLANGASLSGFTLTNGATRSDGDYEREQSGGGVWCASTQATLNHCVLTGNSAATGGGAYGGTLKHCTFTGNSADSGGGARGGTLNNCTLTGNSADFGGGANGSTLNNCTLTGNSAEIDGSGAYGGTMNNCIAYANEGGNYIRTTLNNCCTDPLPDDGSGNITNAPLFMDYVGGNLRLQANSPCINAGLNNYVSDLTDLDGNPRIVNGTVDIGAYEFQGPGSVISYAWLQQYGLPTDGSADYADPDGDGLNNWQEWRCLTDPTNRLSGLRLLSVSPNSTNVTVHWQSVVGVSYFLERSTNLSAIPPFTPLAIGITGQSSTTIFMDTNAASMPRLFYRVGVEQ